MPSLMFVSSVVLEELPRQTHRQTRTHTRTHTHTHTHTHTKLRFTYWILPTTKLAR